MRSEINKNSGFWLLSSVFLFCALFFLFSCSGLQVKQADHISGMPAQVRSDLTVSGEIRVRGEVKVYSGAVLTVAPGTHFKFEPWDPDGDGINDSRLVIEGRIVARGEPDAPIYFSSTSRHPEPGDWLELRIDRSEGNIFEYCVLEDSRYGLHVHFSSGMVANCVFRNNIDGTRFGASRFGFLFNRVTGNLGVGINSRASKLSIGFNTIEKNRHGIFLFEKGGENVIGLNRFADNELSDMRFGDFYSGAAPQIIWNYRFDGTPLRIAGYEGDTDNLQDMFEIDPSSPVPGPFVWSCDVEELWTRDLGSFIDASPVLTDDERKLIVPTWGNGLHVLDIKDGETISRVNVPGVTDATPVLLSGYPSGGSDNQGEKVESVIFPSWDRKIRKADIRSGEILGEINWAPSPADDHRQAAPLLVSNRNLGWPIAIGLWNGQFGLLDPGSMTWIWLVQLDGAVRARAEQNGEDIWVGTDRGSLYRLNIEGQILDEIDLGAPLRSTPLLDWDGNVYIITGAGVLVRIDEGKIVWRRQLPGPGTYASPIWPGDPGDYLVAGDGSGRLSAYRADGSLIWVTNLDSAVNVIAGEDNPECFLVGTEDGSIYCLNMFGRITFSIKTEGAVNGAVLLNDDSESDFIFPNTVVWGSRDGKVRAARLTVMIDPWEIPE